MRVDGPREGETRTLGSFCICWLSATLCLTYCCVSGTFPTRLSLGSAEEQAHF